MNLFRKLYLFCFHCAVLDQIPVLLEIIIAGVNGNKRYHPADDGQQQRHTIRMRDEHNSGNTIAVREGDTVCQRTHDDIIQINEGRRA